MARFDATCTTQLTTRKCKDLKNSFESPATDPAGQPTNRLGPLKTSARLPRPSRMSRPLRSSRSDGHSLSIFWVTNLAAPYRLPVWRHLEKRHQLTVGLLESNSRLGHDSHANRGPDWLHPIGQELAFQELPTLRFHRGESRYYVLTRFRALMNIREFDAVLFGGWESPAYWSLLAAAIVFRKGRVGFYESPSNTMTHVSGLIAWMRRRFFRSMHVVVVPGRAAAQSVLAMGVEPHRVMRGFNAVDVDKFHSASVVSINSLVSAPEGHRYLYVGQLIERKRVDAIIDAFVKVATPNDELTIVGTGVMREELMKAASRTGATISFVGHVENNDMPALMAGHQTLILASQQEVWGLVVNEALAAGMHAVVTDNCGVVPSVMRMKGVYVAKNSLADLSEQLRKSRSGWAGRIEKPEILQHTPESFANVFEAAFFASVTQKQAMPSNTGGRAFCQHDN